MYHYTTVSRTILSDLYTPVSLYMKVRDIYTESLLMESSDYHGEQNSRSYIGFCPMARISINHGKIHCSYPNKERTEASINELQTPDRAIRSFLKKFKVTGADRALCGVYGYTSFDAVKYLENIPIKEVVMEKEDAPDLLYILYKYTIVFDHFNSTLRIIELIGDGEQNTLDSVERLFYKMNTQVYDFHPIGDVESPLTDEKHKENIRKCISHCQRGDVFQIVISRRFMQRYEGDDFKLYRALRSINPSPYLFYFDFGGFRIFGSSPETHCCITSRHAYIDPIAGTIKRTGNVEEDKRNALYLKNDEKENAEHVMLVDLARNDLSRNCHNVHIDSFKEMQYYSHVIHLVSRVSGEMDHTVDSIKTFLDTFPAGTLSGAPKVRAMQLINQYEPHNRGAYGGCIGFIGFNGDLNQAIVIRTFISRNGELWFQAGGGIVAKSNDENELQEVNNKLGALRKAILLAEKM
ncbi:MAG: anthranilate synthase component I family protein [Bacteroidaceae bacterium]